MLVIPSEDGGKHYSGHGVMASPGVTRGWLCFHAEQGRGAAWAALHPCRSWLSPPAQLTVHGKTSRYFLLNITIKGDARCHLQGAGKSKMGLAP